MYEINVILERIDYDKTINTLLPGFIEKCYSKDSRNMIFKLLKKLDDTALVIASDILSLVSENDKMELLKCLVNFYDSELTTVINRLLRESVDEGAELGGLVIRGDSSRLRLVLCNVKLDFTALANKLPSSAAMLLKPLLKMGGEHEKSILRFVQQNKYIWGALISKLEKKLHEKGFFVYIQDIEISESVPALNYVNTDRSFALTPELEDSIINALALYLKSHCNP